MNTQAPTIPGVDPFTFAGFQWPRHLARMACGPAALRKKWAGRKVCGEYYHAPRPETAGTGRGFYLDSDGQPFTRWQWCDEVDGVRINHTGWFCDEYGDGGKIRGIVVALPHGRFLAGWSMGEGMASTIDADLYDTAEDAAHAADSMAESAAEEYKEFFFDCFARLAGHYPAPDVSSDYDKSVIFEAIEKGEEAEANGGAA